LKRKIAVITSSRADYSHLYWVLRELSSRPELDVRVIAMGPHLSPEFGCTVRQIEEDGFQIAGRIECLLSSDTDVGMAKTIGLATLSLADLLGHLRPDLLLLIADRYEMLAPASAALALRIPVAHIEGGEISEGAIDDAVRNALTKMSHVHFTSTPQARERIIAMGEEEWRVHMAGAPSLDHLKRQRLFSLEELQRRLGLVIDPKSIMVAYHPVTTAPDTLEEADAVFRALEVISGQILFCYPNADAGSRALIERTKSFLEGRPRSAMWINLDPLTYWSLLGQVDVFVGNSSSGIMETPSFCLPTVNIGLRQHGREQAPNVLNAPADSNSIVRQIQKAQTKEFRRSLDGMTNPYGDGDAARRIAEVLGTVPVGRQLFRKRSANCAAMHVEPN
jgi:UDP-hydrolysing UDP-N-acetyl-D-glucosamine 2-epimerase